MKRQKSMIRILTNRSFKANKTRNLVAIFAIVLTTVMFTSLFVLSQSMVENLRNMNFQQAGYNSHLSSGIMTDADVEKITTHEAVRDFGKSIVVGIAENKELTGRQVEIRYADENYARSSFSYPTEGTMPVQENEIALDTITLDKMGLPYELGQKITLQWRKDLNGEEITTSIFTLSGYWNGNSAAMASMAWVSEAFVQSQCAGIDQVEQLANGQVLGTVMLHIDLYSDSNLEGAAEQILADTGLSNVSLSPNAAYDSTMNQNINREVLPMAICMVLVFASGYLIIYNIFQISVASDIRFYGRLKTLGTTKRQLKKMIYGQANRLSLIGIPIGLVIGYLLGAVLVRHRGRRGLAAAALVLCAACYLGEWRINRWTYAIPAESAADASALNESLAALDGTVLFLPYGVRQRDSQLIETYIARDVYIVEYETLLQSGALADGVLDLTAEAVGPEYPGRAYEDLTAADWVLPPMACRWTRPRWKRRTRCAQRGMCCIGIRMHRESGLWYRERARADMESAPTKRYTPIQAAGFSAPQTGTGRRGRRPLQP